jgi:hypothetical protein
VATSFSLFLASNCGLLLSTSTSPLNLSFPSPIFTICSILTYPSPIADFSVLIIHKRQNFHLNFYFCFDSLETYLLICVFYNHFRVIKFSLRIDDAYFWKNFCVV